MRIRLFSIFFTVILILVAACPYPAMAHTGMPGSPAFGYGAFLDPLGKNIDTAIATAKSNNLDWLGIEFDWGRIWPDRNASPALKEIGVSLERARSNNLAVLIAIRNAPAWACNALGPDPQQVANLVQFLAKVMPDTVLAFELFPGANTSRGWGTTPNPQAYLSVIRASQDALLEAKSSAVIIASLTPHSAGQADQDMDNLVFLKTLYQNQGQARLPIIGIRYTKIIGDPLTSPTDRVNDVLRHYELVRRVMLDTDHRKDIIWITGFTWPDQTIDEQSQAMWVYQAFKQLQSQLYIGAGFFFWLNQPNPETTTLGQASLITPDLKPHPAFYWINRIASNQTQPLESPKELSNNYPEKPGAMERLFAALGFSSTTQTDNTLTQIETTLTKIMRKTILKKQAP
jgi:hypothetical protein